MDVEYNAIKLIAYRKVRWQENAKGLPKARTLICVDCGKMARDYDHFMGYENPLMIQPVCRRCHNKRERLRGHGGFTAKKASCLRICFVCFRPFKQTNNTHDGQVVCGYKCKAIEFKLRRK